MPFRGIGPLELLLMIPLFLVGLAVYFLPTVIAAFRRHPNTLAIFLIDFLLGWTFLGWVAAFVWSLVTPGTPAPGRSDAVEIAKERYARGDITLVEFEDIKRNIT
jgi:uncharacterized membrane protein